MILKTIGFKDFLNAHLKQETDFKKIRKDETINKHLEGIPKVSNVEKQ